MDKILQELKKLPKDKLTKLEEIIKKLEEERDEHFRKITTM